MVAYGKNFMTKQITHEDVTSNRIVAHKMAAYASGTPTRSDLQSKGSFVISTIIETLDCPAGLGKPNLS